MQVCPAQLNCFVNCFAITNSCDIIDTSCHTLYSVCTRYIMLCIANNCVHKVAIRPMVLCVSVVSITRRWRLLSLSESAHYRIKNNVRSMSRRPHKNRVRHVFWPYVIQCDLGALTLILCLFCILVFSAHFICACLLLLCWISCLENSTTFLPIEYRQEGIPVIEYVPSNCYTF